MSKEKLSKDKEICRQHVFRLLQPKKGIALQAQGSTTVPMWLQAPYQKGECTMRLLFYYTVPESSSTSVKYRLVRQSWCFNVHECLRTEVALVNRNIVCNELGLDVNIMNENGVHDPLNAELYINSLALFSLQYRLNMGNPHFINQTEITVGQLGDCCLKRSKSASFQCRLKKIDTQAEANASTEQLLKMFLSSVNIMPTNNADDSQVPTLNEMHSFLVKHETIFFKPCISSEDFNSGLNNAEQHSTVVLIWSSVISQNSLQRVAFGQSFIQLNRLYEVGTCPREIESLLLEYKASEPTHLIYHFPTKDSHIVEENASTMELHVKNIWEYNENVEETRCLLEEESLILAVKM